jgi:hypothetical protein
MASVQIYDSKLCLSPFRDYLFWWKTESEFIDANVLPWLVATALIVNRQDLFGRSIFIPIHPLF